MKINHSYLALINFREFLHLSLRNNTELLSLLFRIHINSREWLLKQEKSQRRKYHRLFTPGLPNMGHCPLDDFRFCTIWFSLFNFPTDMLRASETSKILGVILKALCAARYFRGKTSNRAHKWRCCALSRRFIRDGQTKSPLSPIFDPNTRKPSLTLGNPSLTLGNQH